MTFLICRSGSRAGPAKRSLRPPYAEGRLSNGPLTPRRCLILPVECRERGMADGIYLAIGGGAFVLFGLLAAGLRRV